MIDAKSVVSKLKGGALGGAKIPHGLSNPVLRVMEGNLYIAVFVYIYNRENLQLNRMPRPIHWIIADISTGDIIKEFDCRINDFSRAAYENLYDLNDQSLKKPTRDDFAEIYSLLDSVRMEYLESGKCDYETYGQYLDRILEITPRSYRQFYQELSNLREGILC